MCFFAGIFVDNFIYVPGNCKYALLANISPQGIRDVELYYIYKHMLYVDRFVGWVGGNSRVSEVCVQFTLFPYNINSPYSQRAIEWFRNESAHHHMVHSSATSSLDHSYVYVCGPQISEGSLICGHITCGVEHAPANIWNMMHAFANRAFNTGQMWRASRNS